MTQTARRAIASLGAWRSDSAARWLFIWPTVVLILFVSIFPLSPRPRCRSSNLVFEKGDIRIDFVGPVNYSASCSSGPSSRISWACSSPRPCRLAAPDRRRGRLLSAVPALDPGRPRRPARAGRPALRGPPRDRLLVALRRRPSLVEGGRPGALIVTIDLRGRRDRAPVPARPRAGPAGGPAAPRPALLPGRVPHPADDHPGRRRLHVPDDDRHREGPVGALWVGPRPARTSPGSPTPGWPARRGDHRRLVAVDPVHVHRAAGGPRGPGPGGPGGRLRGWREPLAERSGT